MISWLYWASLTAQAPRQVGYKIPTCLEGGGVGFLLVLLESDEHSSKVLSKWRILLLGQSSFHYNILLWIAPETVLVRHLISRTIFPKLLKC